MNQNISDSTLMCTSNQFQFITIPLKKYTINGEEKVWIENIDSTKPVLMINRSFLPKQVRTLMLLKICWLNVTLIEFTFESNQKIKLYKQFPVIAIKYQDAYDVLSKHHFTFNNIEDFTTCINAFISWGVFPQETPSRSITLASFSQASSSTVNSPQVTKKENTSIDFMSTSQSTSTDSQRLFATPTRSFTTSETKVFPAKQYPFSTSTPSHPLPPSFSSTPLKSHLENKNKALPRFNVNIFSEPGPELNILSEIEKISHANNKSNNVNFQSYATNIAKESDQNRIFPSSTLKETSHEIASPISPNFENIPQYVVTSVCTENNLKTETSDILKCLKSYIQKRLQDEDFIKLLDTVEKEFPIYTKPKKA